MDLELLTDVVPLTDLLSLGGIGDGDTSLLCSIEVNVVKTDRVVCE